MITVRLAVLKRLMKKSCACMFLLLFLLPVALSAQSGEWQQLFNGKDLTGWKHVGPGGDTVEDGLIRTHGGMGLLYCRANSETV